MTASTTVTLTGTGVPQVDPACAGPGVLVRHGDIALQFDAGRATTMRLAEAGVRPEQLDALFVTHHHSDHLVGLTDVVMSRWLGGRHDASPLTVVAPAGPSATFVERMLDPWVDDIAVRSEHLHRTGGPQPDVVAFDSDAAIEQAVEVWSFGDVRVSTRRVHHEPVTPAVAFRVDTPAGSVVITGDTVVCDEVAELAAGADVVVYEAFRRDVVLSFADAMPHLRLLAEYHADTEAIGAQMAAIGAPTLVLTHLIPPLSASPDGAQGFVDDIRGAGFVGELVVGTDLTTVTLPGAEAS